MVICGVAKLNSWGLLAAGFSARPKKQKSLEKINLAN